MAYEKRAFYKDMDEIVHDRRRNVRMLTNAQSARVAALAEVLLLDSDGRLKRNTFLTDANGDIRESDTTQRFTKESDHGWHALAELMRQPLAESPREFLRLCCAQSMRDSAPLFREKGLFMKQVVVLADKERDAKGKHIHNTRGLHHIPIARSKAAIVVEEMGTMRRHSATANHTSPSHMARPSHYTEKFAAIAAGSPQDLTAGEFLRHVLVGQGNNRFNHKKIIHLFERALGYSEGHLSSNVLNARGALPQRIQQHLTEITKSDAYFWAKDRYSSAEAQQVSSVLNAYIDQLLKDAAQERDTLTSLQKALKERNSTDTPAR